jgi:hypothetical protein
VEISQPPLSDMPGDQAVSSAVDTECSLPGIKLPEPEANIPSVYSADVKKIPKLYFHSPHAI